MMSRILAIGAALIALWLWWPEAGISHGPGVLAPQPPRQIATSGAPLRFGDYHLQPLARFELEARVLGKQHYRWGREAELSPLDLALGWGRMSDEAVLDDITISQGNRFYYWRVADFPIPRREIETHSANMHLIPADDGVERVLQQLRVGHRIRLRGKLVNAVGNDGWRWNSSLSREDTGAGACELFYVEWADFD